MRLLFTALFAMAMGLISAGCTPRATYDGPTVREFTGRLTHNGEPVSFPAGEEVILNLIFHDGGRPFGIPIKADGTFKIGWMPIGKYSAALQRDAHIDAGAG